MDNNGQRRSSTCSWWAWAPAIAQYPGCVIAPAHCTPTRMNCSAHFQWKVIQWQGSLLMYMCTIIVRVAAAIQNRIDTLE
jgi:hypothetical protein